LSSEEFTNNAYKKTVFSTIEISLVKIREKSMDAENILNVCAFLDAVNIPKHLFQNWLEIKGSLTLALQTLYNHSIISSMSDHGYFKIHRLVQEIIRIRLVLEKKHEIVIKQSLGIIAKNLVFRRENTETWSKDSYILPHAERVVQSFLSLIKREDVSQEILATAIIVMIQIGQNKNNKGDVGAIEEFDKSIDMCTSLTTAQKENFEFISVVEKGEVIGTHKGDFPSSQRCLLEALEIYKSDVMRRSFHYGILQAALGWGFLFYSKDEDQFSIKSVEFLTNATQLFATITNIKHPDIDFANTALGVAYQFRGLLKAADIAVGQVMKEFRKKSTVEQSKDHNKPLIILAHGDILREMGDTIQAEQLIIEAIDYYKDLGITQHPYVAYAYVSLGELCREYNRLEEAKAHFLLAKSMYEYLGMLHDDIEGSGNIHDIACYLLYYGHLAAKDNFERAEIYYLKAADYFFTCHNTNNHLYRGLCFVSLGNLYLTQGKLDLASEKLNNAEIILQDLDHPFLGMLRMSQGALALANHQIENALAKANTAKDIFISFYKWNLPHPNLKKVEDLIMQALQRVG
jgi:tetratricopeptide (TPR) repeat protein